MSLIPKDLRNFPQVKEHNWLNHRLIREFLLACASRYVHGVMVDVGCGVKPYSSVFAANVTQHIGVDLAESVHGVAMVDVIGTAYDTTLADSICDVVLCTEVLEHLERPADAIREMNRILRPGGTVILTVPFIWPVHEAPRDFYRYSEFGLRYLFEDGGFEIVELRPLTGYIVTFTQMSIYYLRRFQRGFLLRQLGRSVNWLLQTLAWHLNRHDKSYVFTNLYGLVARKLDASGISGGS